LIRNFNVQELLTVEFIETLVNLMLKSEDDQLVYDASWILIDITHVSNAYSGYLASDGVLKSLFDLMDKTKENQIKKHLLVVFSNLMSEGEAIRQQILNKTEIVNFTFRLMEMDIPIFLRETVVWLFGELFKTKNEDYISQACPYLPRLLIYLGNSFTKEFLKQILYSLTIITSESQNACNILIEAELMPMLLPYLSISEDPEVIELVINIYFNLVVEDGEALEIFADGIDGFGHIEKLLEDIVTDTDKLKKKEYKTLIVEILKLFISMTDCERGVLNKIIRDSKIPKAIYTLFRQGYRKLNDDIVKFLKIALEKGNSKVKTELLRFNIIDMLYSSLSSDNKPHTVKLALEGFKILLHHGAGFVPGMNIVKVELMKIGADTLIDNICTSYNDVEISKLSSEIIQTYFKEN
jgi:hypothetical protein